jgi:chemotaxis protein MotB
MRAARLISRALAAGILFLAPGCSWLPTPEIVTLREQNRALAEQNRAAVAEIQNLRSHSRDVEDRLQGAEEELAVQTEKSALERQQLANYRRERQELHEQFRGVVQSKTPLRPETTQRLAAISREFPALKFDAQTGATKLDTDILFDAGTAELKPGAEQALRDLVRFLNSPEAKDLRVLVVGHTDDRQIARRPARDKYPNNFYLSADRALAVCDQFRRLGLADARMGVMGFAAHQPVSSNLSATDRQKNRRVEVLVMAPEVPVVGWTETVPSLY